MDVHEELRALGPKLDAVENDILLTVSQLSTVLAELDAPNLEGNRERFLLDEKTRLSKREELLRSKEDRLLAQKQELLRQQTFSLSLRERGAPPFLIFLK